MLLGEGGRGISNVMNCFVDVITGYYTRKGGEREGGRVKGKRGREKGKGKGALLGYKFQGVVKYLHPMCWYETPPSGFVMIGGM